MSFKMTQDNHQMMLVSPLLFRLVDSPLVHEAICASQLNEVEKVAQCVVLMKRCQKKAATLQLWCADAAATGPFLIAAKVTILCPIITLVAIFLSPTEKLLVSKFCQVHQCLPICSSVIETYSSNNSKDLFS